MLQKGVREQQIQAADRDRILNQLALTQQEDTQKENMYPTATPNDISRTQQLLSTPTQNSSITCVPNTISKMNGISNSVLSTPLSNGLTKREDIRAHSTLTKRKSSRSNFNIGNWNRRPRAGYFCANGHYTL